MLKLNRVMRGTLARVGFASVTAVAGALVLFAATAAHASHSSKPHPFTEAKVQLAPGGSGSRAETPKILVGHDGSRYTHLVDDFSALLRVAAKVRAGNHIYGVAVTTGDPDFTSDLRFELIGGQRSLYAQTFDDDLRFTMDATSAVQSATAGIGSNRVQSVIDRCNDAFPGGPPSTDRGVGAIDMHIHVGFSAGPWVGASHFSDSDSWWRSGSRSRPAIAHTTFSASIVCLNRTDPRVAELQPKPVSVVLAVDPKGENCPKETEVTAWIYYDRPATAKFRFKLDGELSGLYTREAVKVGGDGRGPVPKGEGRPDRYLVRETKTYYLDPGQHHFRVEVRGGQKSEVITRRTECPPFKVFSTWLNYDVENKPTCPKEVDETATFKSTRPGKAPFEIKTQGGLVVHKGTAVFERKGKEYRARVKRSLVMNAFDQDMMAEIKNDPAANSGWTRLKVDCMEVLSGTLDLREFAATRCEGEAALSIRANMPGKVPYKLDCTGNRSWSGTANVQQTAPDTFIGVDVHRFDVSNNEQVNCALKTDDPFPVRILQLKGHKYQCHKPSGASGASDIAPPSRPDDPLPPGQTLKGDFTFIDNGGTRCPRQGKALINFTTGQPQNVHYSLDCTNGSFSGVAQTAKSPKGGYVAPALVSFDIEQTTQANCVLKTVAPGKPAVHKLKGHLFQCITPTGVPGASDLSPPTRPDPVVPSGPGRVVVDPPRTVDPVKPTGTGAQIACIGGLIRSGQCTCDRAEKLVATGKNAWRCVKVVVDPPRTPSSTQPKISCAGGSVQYGKCNCERGFNAVAAGTNAFRCVRTATVAPTKTPTRTTPTSPTRTTPSAPKIACLGGAVRGNRCICPGGTSLKNSACLPSSAPKRSSGVQQRVR